MNGHNETLEELSHAWLHIVAVRAGFIYQRTGRPMDNAGIDAEVTTLDHPLLAGVRRTKLTVNVQIKATATLPSAQPRGLPFPLRLADYDRLRATRAPDDDPILLVAVFFPDDPTTWVVEQPDGLSLRGQAYWLSLRGAPPSANASYQTVYLPPDQPLSVDGLRQLMARIARGDRPTYISGESP